MHKVILGFTVMLLLSFKSYSQCNNVNLADGRPTSASFASETGNFLDPWRAFDVGSGSEQTRWGAPNGGDTAYVGIDLGQAYNICSMYIFAGSFDYPSDFKVQGSNNMTTWTDLRTVTGNTQSELTVDNLINSGTYRYVRLYMTQRAYNWAYYNIYQCQIYSRVLNTPPTVDLTAPLAGASYPRGTIINLSADAADVDGTVSKVEFYNGTSLLGVDSTVPYTFNWTNALVGAHDVYAKAIDNGGASTWTDASHINVTPATSWSLTGNDSTNGTKFLGTTDSVALIIKTNNKEYARLSAMGSLHVGTAQKDTSADNGAKLQVHGQLSVDSLRTGTVSDSIVVVNNNFLKKIAAVSISNNWSLSGNNISNSNTGIVSIGAYLNPLPSDANLKLAVNGNVYAKKLKITQTGWPDYVFDSSYHLRPLQEVESFIQQHQHLPEVPSAAEVTRNGVDVGDQQSVLLKKLEELTLYIIEQNKKQDVQQNTINNQQQLLLDMKKQIEALEKKAAKNKSTR
jgi:hypothetical protein